MTPQEVFDGLRNAFRAGRFAQAYVVIGPLRGEGLALTDRVLKMLFCEQADPPCNACRGCAQAEAHTHPDLCWIEPQKKSRIISIDQVRELQGRIYQTSYEAGWKACVIVGADRLHDSASNAFLKTLEEPPPKSVFLLQTDVPQFLLPTIRSRCQQITVSGRQGELPPACEEALLEILVQRPATGGVITAFARGDRVAALLKHVKKELLAEEKERAGESAREETSDTLDARANSRYREIRTGVMRTLLQWYRDLLILSQGGDEAFVHHQPQKEVLKKLAGTVPYTQALKNVRAIEEMNRRLERNMPENQVLAAGFCRLKG